MDQGGKPSLAAQLAASFDWWRDAGVDALFHDEPANWIKAAEDKAEVRAEVRADLRPRAAGDLGQTNGSAQSERGARPHGEAEPPIEPTFARLPDNLADFTAWWLAEPALDSGRTTGRVAPRGSAGAKLMVLIDEPERDDGETLLSGPQGKLLDAMLAAMGFAPEETYIASVLPRHTPHADWDAAARLGLGRIAQHHVKLVAPRELISFGQNIPSLVGTDLPNMSANLLAFHHDGLSLPWLSDRSLSAMLERPRWKAGFWQKWLARNSGLPG